MGSAPLINGRRFSFSSIELTASVAGSAAELFIDVDDISYSESLEIAFRRGTSRMPIGWTAGTYNPGEASLNMGKSTFQIGIVESIGPGWLGANLAVLVKYGDIGEVPIVDSLVTRIIGVEDAHASGPDALIVAVKLQPFMIVRNGIIPVLNRVF